MAGGILQTYRLTEHVTIQNYEEALWAVPYTLPKETHSPYNQADVSALYQGEAKYARPGF
jgi:sporulation-control protein spo0M